MMRSANSGWWAPQAHSEFGLGVAEAPQQEGFAGEIVLEPRHEVRVVARAHGLAAHIFVDLLAIAETPPARRQLGPVGVVPWKMVGRQIHEDEHRRPPP